MSRSKPKSEPLSLVTILLSAFLVTFTINPSITDPINSPKLWVLILICAWLSPTLIERIRVWGQKKDLKYYGLILMGFSLTLIVATIQSENKYRALFGEVQRRNGLLAYLSLIVLGAVAAKINVAKKDKNFFVTLILGTTFLSFYGLIQNFGFDFFAWNNQYSPVIGTLGNPNFMGAILSVLSILLLPALFMKKNSLGLKSMVISLLTLNTIVIYFTKASQAILLLIFGVILYLLSVLYLQYKKIATICFSLFLVGAGITLLGILQKGPFADFLYKSSVSLRGYYWNAGIKMFIDNPLFGVGLDNYGMYFNQFRDLEYPLKYGYFVTANNAHNLPIQLFATGGLFVGVFYLALVFYVFFVGLKKLKNLNYSEKVFLLGLIVSYLAFQFQSIVSIDNLGVAVWGWVIAGFIIGFADPNEKIENFMSHNSQKSVLKTSERTMTPVLSWLLVTITLPLVVILYQGEKKVYDLEGYFLGSNAMSSQLMTLTNQTISQPLLEPNYKMRIADKLMVRGLSAEAMNLATELVKLEPNNLDYLTTRASFAEFLGNYELSIRDRNKIADLNPYNAFNYKLLTDLYLKTNQPDRATSVSKKVGQFAAGTDIANEIESKLIDYEKSTKN